MHLHFEYVSDETELDTVQLGGKWKTGPSEGNICSSPQDIYHPMAHMLYPD